MTAQITSINISALSSLSPQMHRSKELSDAKPCIPCPTLASKAFMMAKICLGSIPHAPDGLEEPFQVALVSRIEVNYAGSVSYP